MGSSPLARGTRSRTLTRCSRSGLIPARAGNTRPSTRAFCGCWAHPRSRGEHGRYNPACRRTLGSSPLARGTQGEGLVLGGGDGLIPARAGNTLQPTLVMRIHRAHPRSRGEHTRQSRRQTFATGSSPLARGTLFISLSNRLFSGLIPARAGNTLMF